MDEKKTKNVGVMILKHPENLMNVVKGITCKNIPLILPVEVPSVEMEKIISFGYNFVLMENVTNGNVVAGLAPEQTLAMVNEGKLFNKKMLNFVPKEYRLTTSENPFISAEEREKLANVETQKENDILAKQQQLEKESKIAELKKEAGVIKEALDKAFAEAKRLSKIKKPSEEELQSLENTNKAIEKLKAALGTIDEKIKAL